MRIIFLSLGAIGAATIGGAALGQSESFRAGHRTAAHAPPAGFPGDSLRRHRGSGRGMHRGPRRHHGRSGRDGLSPFYFGLGGYGDPAERRGDGFFAGGGEVRMEGGRPVYDYDRSYPYESASGVAARGGWREDEPYGAAAPGCTIELGVRVCRGRQ